jgi:chaperonin GroES
MIVRVVANFSMESVRLSDGEMGQRKIMSIMPDVYYVPYHFMPSMDGGFWGTGLGLLLGDISETINSIINMLVDSGHMNSLGGGFLGREFKTKGGVQRFAPGEWKTPNTGGSDLRNAIVPMQFPGPSPVLFQMLGLLIEAGREISSTKDIMTGDSGTKNMTATTTLALIEQGNMVFTAAYKRTFRSLRREFELLAKCNEMYLPAETLERFHDEPDKEGNKTIPIDPRAEFDLRGMDISPEADPRAVTKQQQLAKAQILSEMAMRGEVDQRVATRMVLEAASIGGIEELMPDPSPEEQKMQTTQMQMQELSAQLALETAKYELIKVMAEIDKTLTEVQKSQAETADTIVGGENPQAAMQLMAMLDKMREMKRGIDERLAGRVEGAPGNGAPAQPVQPGMQGSAPVDVRGMAANGGDVGGGPQGFASM